MARTIIITLDFDTPGRPARSAEPFSTDVFDVIAEAARKHFRQGEEACARHCFLALDEHCQEYISLDEVDSACFNAFVRACEAGLVEYRATSTTAWGRRHESRRVQHYAWEWSELIKKLHGDPRYGQPRQALQYAHRTGKVQLRRGDEQ
ncbi:hypothetical protein C7T35_02770 [Variovorax sp. WS11]|uniref:hypothetical protein n=1 Tax=Variovorax sp. WS11 TaxID=1105204 RepID=UPI000D0D1CCD|nr:hypothetical protein [Variovorax sp. WS11]NDZ16773.1 hypothetical protein [Variovorax sp. WS11]PSL86387.1 hypothetical protein C7T35_02770 [Variovorax sp. WS11]